MVLRLGEALDLPLRERNHMLHAACLPAAYPEAGLHSPDLAPFQGAIDSLLHAHLPYPATVVDARWNVLFANTACSRLYGGDLAPGTNVVRRFLTDPAAAQQAIINWAEVAWAAVDRLRQLRDRTPSDDQITDR